MSTSYNINEDVASSIEIRELSESETELPRVFVRTYGPQCGGCQNHEMALMLSYREGKGHFKDVFLDGVTALKFISDIETRKINLSLKPLVISFDAVLDETTKSFLIDNRCLKILFQDIDNVRDEVSSYVETYGLSDPEDKPVRAKLYQPPSAEEQKRFRQIDDEYYKPEPRDISFAGVEPGFLLAALYNNANPNLGATMTPPEGTHIWNEISRIQKPHEFDYINGRSIKCWFTNDETISFSRYGDYNTMPLTAVIALARQAIYVRAPDDFRTSAAECVQSVLASARDTDSKATAEEFTDAMNSLVKQIFSDQTISDMLEQQISMYRQNMIDGAKRTAIVPHEGIYQYQVSLIGEGDVGQYFKAFDAKTKLTVVPHGRFET